MKTQRRPAARSPAPPPAIPGMEALRGFGAETLIETRRGEVPARDVTDRDHLRTREGGWCPVDWVEHLSFGARMLAAEAGARPVLICAGELGPGRPRRNTVLTPGQPVWVETDSRGGAFYPARDLTANPGLYDGRDIAVSYVILGCGMPAVVRAEGLWVRLAP